MAALYCFICLIGYAQRQIPEVGIVERKTTNPQEIIMEMLKQLE
jgi:hypothetical protein